MSQKNENRTDETENRTTDDNNKEIGEPPRRHVELNALISMGMSLFDVRNWYKACVHLKKVGEGVLSQSMTTWDLFLDTEHLGQGIADAGTVIHSCPLCRKKMEAESLVLRPAEYEGSPSFAGENGTGGQTSGAWIFVSDIEEFIDGPDTDSNLAMDVGAGEPNPAGGPVEVERTNIPNIPSQSPGPPSESAHETTALKTDSSATRRPASCKKSPTTTKSAKRKATASTPRKREVAARKSPLVCQRPKRPRREDDD